ncbi:MAG TPA: iron-sulfur cluster assembly scaffold protein [Gammaproteobacteria bacterium]|nr:iron-sulfur cluster assembly scaffold protein [Gammaproteobacteria bacterium]
MHPGYNDRIWQHFEKPVNVGGLDPAVGRVGTGYAGDAAHGELVRMQVRVNRAGAVETTRFKAQGPVALIACGSLAAQQLVAGHGPEPDAAWLGETLALAPADRGAALLVEDAWREALAEARGRAGEVCDVTGTEHPGTGE